MTLDRRPRRSQVLTLWLTLALLCLPLSTVMASHWKPTPVVYEWTGDEGDAWALAIRSDDEPTSFRGNQLVVMNVLKGDHVRSAATVGIYELTKGEDGTFKFAAGGVGAHFTGGDRVFVQETEPPLERPELANFDLEVLGEENGTLGFIGEIRAMQPGEWRYFVAWAAGSEESRLRLRGDGFEVRELIEGEGWSFGNTELIDGQGVYARQGAELPPGTSHRASFLGAGMAATTNAGVGIQTDTPLLGFYGPFHSSYACSLATGCLSTGSPADAAVSEAVRGGFSNTSLVTPEAGHVWQDHGYYSLMPNSRNGWYTATTPGTYEFRVDHLLDPTGPSYRDPFTGTGAVLEGEELLVSLAEIDYRGLRSIEEG